MSKVDTVLRVAAMVFTVYFAYVCYMVTHAAWSSYKETKLEIYWYAGITFPIIGVALLFAGCRLFYLTFIKKAP